MGQLVLGIAGAVLGPATFGVSAAIGWAVGSAIGAMAFPPKQPTQYNIQQELSDLRVVGAEYGQSIPYIRGSMLTAGQMIWNSDRRAITTISVTAGRRGGKGGGRGGGATVTKTITYEMDALYLLTDNEIDGVARVFDNAGLVWTAAAAAGADSIMASGATASWDRMTVYTGAAAQLPDATYELAVGTVNACAYRGRGTVFIQGLKLGQSGQVRNLTFEVVADGVIAGAAINLSVQGTITNSFSADLDIGAASYYGNGLLWIYYATGGVAYSALIDTRTGSILLQLPQVALFTFATQPIYTDEYDRAYFAPNPYTRVYRVSTSGGMEYFNTSSAVYGGLAVDSNANLWRLNSGSTPICITNIDWRAHTCTETAATGGTFNRFLKSPGAVIGRVYGARADVAGVGYVDIATLTVTTAIAGVAGLSSSGGSSFAPAVIGADGRIYLADPVGGGGAFLRKYSADGALLGSLAMPVPSGNELAVYMYDSDGIVWCRASDASSAWQKVKASSMLVDSTVPVNGYTHIIAKTPTGIPVFWGNTAATGNYGKIGVAEPHGRITADSLTAQTIQSEICLRAGLTAGQIDVTGLSTITKPVRTFVWGAGTTARAASEALMASHFYEAVSGEKVKFIPRGGAAVAALAYLDLGAANGEANAEPLPLQEINDLEIPAQISVSYVNVSNDYQIDAQQSDRLISAANGTVAAVTLGVGMTPAEAKGVADTMLLDMTASRYTSSIGLLGTQVALEPSDVVTVTAADGTALRLRLVKKTDSYPLLQFDAVLDDATVISSQQAVGTDYTSDASIVPLAAVQLQLLDIPILRDSDNHAGYYVAAKGSTTNYPGAAVYGSVDNVTYAVKTLVEESGTFGFTTTALGTYSGPRIFDSGNAVTVNVGNTLASSTYAAILNDGGLNLMLIGDEVIQFVTAALVSTGVYTLSQLLRGGRGTEWAMTGHFAGERAVLLSETGMRRVAMLNADIGATRYVKAVSIGEPASAAEGEAFIDTAIGLKPFSPFFLRATRDGSNNATLAWERRSRLNVRMIGSAGISCPLGEEVEAYEIDLFTSSSYATKVRTIAANSTSMRAAARQADYSSAEQTLDGLTPGATLHAKVYQMSAVIGRGYALTGAI